MLCVGVCMKVLLRCSQITGSSSMKILWDTLYRRLFFCYLLKFSYMSPYEVLVWSPDESTALPLAPQQIPVAAVPTMSNLICYCSVATGACIWYIGFLPPKLFGASFRCNLFLPRRSHKLSRIELEFDTLKTRGLGGWQGLPHLSPGICRGADGKWWMGRPTMSISVFFLTNPMLYPTWCHQTWCAEKSHHLVFDDFPNIKNIHV